MIWEDAARLADALGPAARRDLLQVLTSPSEVRADVIRQLHERPDGQEIADLLIFLEGWEWARQGMIEELSRAYASSDWHQPDDSALAPLYEVDAEPLAEDAAIQQSLMNAGHADHVEFMG